MLKGIGAVGGGCWVVMAEDAVGATEGEVERSRVKNRLKKK